MFYGNLKKLFAPDDIASDGAEVSENMTEVAEQSEDEMEDDSDDDSEEEETSVEAEVTHQQSKEDNSRYAAARREAEAQMKAFQTRQSELDNAFASMFGEYTNPITGQPIKTANDYLEAMRAQNKLAQEQELKNAGLDPNLIENAVKQAVAVNPAILEAQAIIEKNRQAETSRKIQEDVDNIKALDPTVSSIEDISKQDNFKDLLQYVQTHPGTRLHEAYRIVNFERLSGLKQESAKQQAINQAKSKNHLSKEAGVVGDSGMDIPVDELARWKEWFPEKSPKELKRLYNTTVKRSK